MYLENLSLVEFKNYSEAYLKFSDEFNCFIGLNGSGKTNLLDAIHYLSLCKSFLNQIDSRNIKWESPFFVIQGIFNKNQEQFPIYCGVKKGQKKIFKRKNNEYEKLADHIGLFPLVLISPYDRNLILEGSETRRKFIDSIISQLNKKYLNVLIKYNKVLTQRNALLKNNLKNGLFDRESIDIWDEQLHMLGHEIFTHRELFLKEFIPYFIDYYTFICNEKENVEIRYKSELNSNQLKNLLIENHQKDSFLGYTTKGIHRDDIEFLINKHPVKKYGSQGQQKSFLIALKLAQFEFMKTKTEEKPIVLLDDIFDKLDYHRVEKIVKLVSDKKFGQVFVTDTDIERIKNIFKNMKVKIKLFKVNDGVVNEANIINQS